MKRIGTLLTLSALLLVGCDFPDGNLTNGGNAYIQDIHAYKNGWAQYTIKSGIDGGGLSFSVIMPNDFGKVGERVIVISTNGMKAIVAVAPIVKAED